MQEITQAGTKPPKNKTRTSAIKVGKFQGLELTEISLYYIFNRPSREQEREVRPRKHYFQVDFSMSQG